MTLEIGKLYHLRLPFISMSMWKNMRWGEYKKIVSEDILLLTDIQHLARYEDEVYYFFLDKDGDELWFKENETYDLEEAK